MREGVGTGLLLLALALPAGALAADPVTAYTITDGAAIEESLTGAPGDASRGAGLFAAAEPAGCAGCHGFPGAAANGSAPDLTNLGARMSPGSIRLWIVAPSVLVPDTAMPAFYAAGQRQAAEDPMFGGPTLTAQQIEDLVAYLAAAW
jgi:sulfur-oxidizing protein SoxX